MWNNIKVFCGHIRYLNREYSLFSLSAEAAYYLILNAVPFLMLLLNILFLLASPYSEAIKSMIMSLPLGLESVAGKYSNEVELIHQLVNNLPYDLSKVINDRIDVIIASRVKEISVAGLLSLGLTAWASIQGISVLVQASDPESYLNRYAPILRFSKAWLVVRLKALAFAVGMVGIIGIIFILMISGNTVFYSLHYLVEDYPFLEMLVEAPLYLWNIILYAIPFLLLLQILTMFYRYAPSRLHRHGWSGSFYMGLTVALLWMITAGGYSYYLANYSALGPVYGSLFGVVLLIVWLRVISCLIIGGGYVLLAYERCKAEPALPSPEEEETQSAEDGLQSSEVDHAATAETTGSDEIQA